MPTLMPASVSVDCPLCPGALSVPVDIAIDVTRSELSKRGVSIGHQRRGV